MRIYKDCYQLMSEIMREVWEMGHIVHPKSMQNKDVSKDENFQTKEIINYQYCLEKRDNPEVLFFFDKRSEDWTKKEFLERVNSVENIPFHNPGEAWKLRRDLWEQFLNISHEFDYTYGERFGSFGNLSRIIEEIKNNPDSRQLILSVWAKADICNIGGFSRVPCSIYYQFIVRGDKLHIVYNQRSADVVAHLGNDIWLAWELGAYVAQKTGYQMGFLYHNITSLHCYKKDWDTLQKGISFIHEI